MLAARSEWTLFTIAHFNIGAVNNYRHLRTGLQVYRRVHFFSWRDC